MLPCLRITKSANRFLDVKEQRYCHAAMNFVGITARSSDRVSREKAIVPMRTEEGICATERRSSTD